jgi:predicted P-loop ATPase
LCAVAAGHEVRGLRVDGDVAGAADMSAALDEAARDRIRREQEQINLEQIRKHGAEARETGGLPIPRDAPGVRAADWTLTLAKKGERFAGDERNVAMALRTAPELRALVRHNRFSQAVELTRSPPWRSATPGESWTDDDDVALQIWLQERGLDVRSRATVGAPVVLDAKERPYHPVLAYLKGLSWDGTARLDTWLMDHLDCEGPPEYLRAVGRAWLVSAVARIRQPGCQVDHVLVLEGPQGAGKSRTARILAVQPDWFCGDLPDLGNKDALLQLAGKWIIELGELAAIRRAELERVKGFISQPSDVYRPPYARRAVTIPRQSVFLATTNESEYLRDRTGNRRFWPVRVGRIDLDALERDRNQLWAEAYLACVAGDAWHLTGADLVLAEAQQSERVQRTELESAVHEYLDAQVAAGRTETTMRDVLVYGLRLDPDQGDYVERARRLGTDVAQALQENGWQSVGRQGRGANRRRVYRLSRPE